MQVKESVVLFLMGCCAGVLSARAQSSADAGQQQPDASIDPLASLEAGLPWRSMVDDPLGLEPSDEDLGKSLLRDIDENAKKKAKAGDAHLFGPLPPPYRAKKGKVVTAVAAVREREHKTAIDIAHGLAKIAVTMRFVSISDKPAEVRYRLAIPSESGLESLKVCNTNGCRTGVIDRPSELSLYDDAVLARGPKPTLPIAHAAFRKDSRGSAIVVRAAPILKGSDLTVNLNYVSPIRQHNGIARLQLPARGMDPRAAPTAFEFSDSLRDNLVSNTPLKSDAWIPTEIVARTSFAAKRQIEAWRFSCNKKLCGRARVAAATEPLQPVDLTLFIDASPSMVGPARGRVATAVSVLLANAPPGTRARALVFAARSKPIVKKFVDVNEIPLASIANAIVESELGSATRFENAWETAKAWTKRRRSGRNRSVVVIVGDGGLTTGRSYAKPFSEAKRAGVEVSVLNLADRDAVPELQKGVESTGGMVVNAAAESERASRGYGTAALEDRIAALFARTAEKRIRLRIGRKTFDLGPLRSGEELVWEGPLETTRFRLFVGTRAIRFEQAPDPVAHGLEVRLARALGMKSPREVLAAVDPEDFKPSQTLRPARSIKKDKCDPRGPAWKKSGISSDEAPVALAEQRGCHKSNSQKAKRVQPVKPGKGMPSEPLLFMLRNRIIPVARACFRRDRAGRPNYSKRAVFRFQLSEREVTSADIEGAVSQKLRKCLLSAVDTLDVPFFSGNVIVRYPLITEAEPLPHQIELTPETAKQVDSLLRESRPRSP
jgi:hypothetical protein